MTPEEAQEERDKRRVEVKEDSAVRIWVTIEDQNRFVVVGECHIEGFGTPNWKTENAIILQLMERGTMALKAMRSPTKEGASPA